MPINPAIAMGVKGLELENPINQFAKFAQIQGAQRENALAQMKMDEYQRSVDEQNRLRAYLGEADLNTEAGRKGLIRFGKVGAELGKTLIEQEKEGRLNQKAQVDLVDAKLKQSRAFLDTIDPNAPGAADAYIAWHEGNHKDPVLGPVLTARGITADQSRARIQQALNTPGGLAQLINQSKLGTEKFMELNKPTLSTKDTGAELIDRTFEPLTQKVTEIGRTAKAMAPGEKERIDNERKRIVLEGQRLGLEGRRVAVMEENAKRDADPEFQRRMSAAKATGEAITKGDIAAQQALPKIIGRAEEGMRLIDELIGKRDSKGKLIEGSKPHPGFEGSVGATWAPGARFIPGTDAAGFMARFDQIKGASFLEAFESLKGGGAITEKEGSKGTDAINRMSTSTDEKEFIRAAMDLQEVIRKGVENAQKRVSRTGGGAKPTSPNIDALLEKYK